MGIPNIVNISEDFRGQYYDPDDKYSVPYTYGMVGIIYNTNMVDEADAGSWDLLWNEKYSGKILQFNNSRDAFATAQFMMMGEDNYEGATSYINASVLDEGGKEIYDRALEKLKEQQPLIQKYVMDEVFNKMERGDAALAPYYAGDALTIMEENDSLNFVVPKSGTNLFVDAMCIPKTAENKEAAENFRFLQLLDL